MKAFPLQTRILILLVIPVLLIILASSYARAQDVTAENPDKLYSVRYTTGPNWDQSLPFNEQENARAHSAYLRQMRENGTIIFGARYGEVGLIVLSVKSGDDARMLIEQDPAVTAGVFKYQLDQFSVFYGWELQPE